MTRASCVGALCAALWGCATPGARPHDMNVAGHEAAAQREDAVAATHQSHYDFEALQFTEQCRSPQHLPAELICWTTVGNPTAYHRLIAEEHRRRAADHRAASAALREAEARACAGVAQGDRDMSPFEHAEEVGSVEPVSETRHAGGARREVLVGAKVAFRAVPGMTVASLQRVVDCHLARNTSLGHQVPEMPSCPLVPKGATATVTATP